MSRPAFKEVRSEFVLPERCSGRLSGCYARFRVYVNPKTHRILETQTWEGSVVAMPGVGFM